MSFYNPFPINQTFNISVIDNVTKKSTYDLLNKLDSSFIGINGITITNSEFSTLDNITSNVQTQLNTKQAQISSSNRIDPANIGTGLVSLSEYNYLKGLSGSIQTQLDSKASSASSGSLTGDLVLGSSYSNTITIYSSIQGYLKFSNGLNRKIIFYDGIGTLYNFYGFAVEGGVVRYNVDYGCSHVFSCGNAVNGTSFTEFGKFTLGGLTTVGISNSGNTTLGTNSSNTISYNGTSNTNINLGSTNQLVFSAGVTGRKIVIYDSGVNNFQFYGLSLGGGYLQYNVDVPGAYHVFTSGNASSASTSYTEFGRFSSSGLSTSGINNSGNTILGTSTTNTISYNGTSNTDINVGTGYVVKFTNALGKKLIFFDTALSPHNYNGVNIESGITRFNVDWSSVFIFSGGNASTSTAFAEYLKISPSLTNFNTPVIMNSTFTTSSTNTFNGVTNMNDNVTVAAGKSFTTNGANIHNGTTNLNDNVTIATNKSLTFTQSLGQKVVLHAGPTLFNNYMIAVETGTIRYNLDYNASHKFSMSNTYTGTSFIDLMVIQVSGSTIYTNFTVTGTSILAAVTATSLTNTGSSSLASVTATSLTNTGLSSLAAVTASSLTNTGLSTLSAVTTSGGDFNISGSSSGKIPCNFLTGIASSLTNFSIGSTWVPTTGTSNIGIGNSSTCHATTGNQNICFGNAAGAQVNTGYANVYIGSNACTSNNGGAGNVSIGIYSGTDALNTSYSTYLGSNTAGNYSNSTAIGYGCMLTANNQIKLGTSSETINIPKLAGSGSRFVQSDNLGNLATSNVIPCNYISGIPSAPNNYLFGSGSTPTGIYNVGICPDTNNWVTSGSNNICFGKASGSVILSASGNVYIGTSCGSSNTGSGNTGIGDASNSSNTNTTNSTFIGKNSGGNFNYSTAVGQNCQLTANNQIKLGTVSETVNIPNLAGSGTRTVQADLNGNLIPLVSDARLKNNIEYLNDEDSLNKVLQLRPASYFWNYDENSQFKDFGIIAQDTLETGLSDLVVTNPINEFYGVNSDKLFPFFIGSIKAQNKTIQTLQDQITLMQTQINILLNNSPQ